MKQGIALLEPHIPALRRYAFALTRDRVAGDDLVQDCLERAIDRWYLHRPDADLRAWLFSILHNLFISAMRQKARRGPHGALDEDHVAVPGGQEAGLLKRDMLRALEALSEDQRAVLLLVGVEGMSYETASAVLGVPIGTIMSRLSRGREQLRRLLEGEHPPGLRPPALGRVK